MNVISPVYETLPVGGPDQPVFFNAAVEVETALDPLSLLRMCCAIETDMGRERNVRWGPRTIDIDILLYDRQILAGEELTIPHPLMQVRAFVMHPLADIAPDIVHPVIGKTAAEIRDGIGSEGTRRRDDLNLSG